MNHLICDKLKEIVNLQDIIKTDELHYESKRIQVYIFSEYSLPIVFLREIQERYLSLEDTHDEQSNFPAN